MIQIFMLLNYYGYDSLGPNAVVLFFAAGGGGGVFFRYGQMPRTACGGL